jgi:hypothetical protein
MLSVLMCGDGTAATSPAAAPPPSGLPEFGRSIVDELKKPEYAVSRCMLTPVLASDQVTVAASVDHVFSAGDVLVAVGDDRIDPTAKTPLRDLLMKHGPTGNISIGVRRGNKELVLTAVCADAKPYFDLLLEAGYAASKNDPAGCADKLDAAKHVHAPNYPLFFLAVRCNVLAGRLAGNSVQSQNLYEMNRELILENKWSPDALGRIRGTLLTAIETLKKSGMAYLGDDLKGQLDEALAGKSPEAAALSNGSH